MEREISSKETITHATANPRYGFTVSSLDVQPTTYLADPSDRPSSMETLKSTSKPASHLAVSSEKAQKVGRPDIRSMEEVMAGTAEDETVPRNNHVNAAGKQASNDVFDFPDSDRDVAREDTRIPSPVCYIFLQACNRS